MDNNFLTKQWYKKTTHSLIVLIFYFLFYILFFPPVIFTGRLLTPGDGTAYYLPNFHLGRMLWDPSLQSGFPVAADPQAMTWYPLALIFSLICSWNAFIISAYVLASCFTYGYVFTLTQSRLAAVASGIIYGMCGFMMAHLGHTRMIHAAAWMPLLIWALEKLRNKFSFQWFAVACVAVACSALSGHLQIFVYGLGFSLAYALILGWSLELRRWKYYLIYLATIVVGLTLSTIQLLPTIELGNLGMRAQMNFAGFNECFMGSGIHSVPYRI